MPASRARAGRASGQRDPRAPAAAGSPASRRARSRRCPRAGGSGRPSRSLYRGPQRQFVELRFTARAAVTAVSPAQNGSTITPASPGAPADEDGAADPAGGAEEPAGGAAGLANGSTIAPIDDGRARSGAVASACDGLAAPEAWSAERAVGGAVVGGAVVPRDAVVEDGAVAAGCCDGDPEAEDPDAEDEGGGGSIGVMIGAEGSCAAGSAELAAGSMRAGDTPG